MTPITVNRVEDFVNNLRPGSGIYADIYEYVIRIEERLNCSSHLGKSMFAHPGNDTLVDALKDVQAIVTDSGVTLVKN